MMMVEGGSGDGGGREGMVMVEGGNGDGGGRECEGGWREW